MKKFYITTPIYYPSGNWHLGNCYSTVNCDALARYYRQRGYDVFFTTGTDEHGQKIADAAEKEGISPQSLTDSRAESLKQLFGRLDIDCSKFVRTTEQSHMDAVRQIFNRLLQSGDIYKAEYSGPYCKPCEAYFTRAQLVDGCCPDCKRPVEVISEESYFFRLSKYADRLLDLLENTDFLEPKSRVNEMVNFIRGGLNDVAVTRTSFSWGVKVESDPKHIVYVWIDALINYLSSIGYLSDDDSLFKKYWPCDAHITGKEIVRFHAVIFPAMLLALGLPLPKKVFGHGWLLFDGDKMSKSKGNTADPNLLIDRYGSDCVRYFLLREVSFGSDGAYSHELFVNRINTDLVNDLGNLVRRVFAMAKQYFNSEITDDGIKDERDAEFIALIDSTAGGVDEQMKRLCPSRAAEVILKTVGVANKYIEDNQPWVLAKTDRVRLMRVLYNLVEAIRVCALLLEPFIPQKAPVITRGLGIKSPKFEAAVRYGAIRKYKLCEMDILFPRIDLAKEAQEIAEINAKKENNKVQTQDVEVKKAEADEKPTDTMISIDEFFRVSLKTGVVLSAEAVEKADKLLKLSVKIGDETRTIVSGIAKHYAPCDLVGKVVVVVVNLKPAKLRGIVSEGMILCASDDEGRVVLVSPESAVADGLKVS